MKKDFFTQNSRSILIISVLMGIWFVVFLFNRDSGSVERLINQPKKGQIYIFQQDNFYAPMRLDSVSDEELFMRNYQFLFEDAIPKIAQIESSEFDTIFYAIYKREEMNRLFEAGNLVQIYP